MFSEFTMSSGVLDSVKVTAVMSFFSTIISSLLGISLGILLERKNFIGKKLIVRTNRTLMGAPPVVIGLIAYLILRRKGPLGSLGWVFTIQGMVFAQVIIITPIISSLVYTYAVQSAPAIRIFAKNMGANKSQTNWLVIKELKHEILFAILTGFSRSISEVGSVYLIGGNIKGSTRTMTTAITTLKSAGEFEDGIIIGVILLIMAFIIQWLVDLLKNEEVVYNENY